MSISQHQLHSGPFTFYLGGSRSKSFWEKGAKQLLKEGNPFFAMTWL